MGGQKNRAREGEKEGEKKALNNIIRTPEVAMYGLIKRVSTQFLLLDTGKPVLHTPSLMREVVDCRFIFSTHLVIVRDQGFSALTVQHQGQIILCCGAALCIVGYLAESLTSTPEVSSSSQFPADWSHAK